MHRYTHNQNIYVHLSLNLIRPQGVVQNHAVCTRALRLNKFGTIYSSKFSGIKGGFVQTPSSYAPAV